MNNLFIFSLAVLMAVCLVSCKESAAPETDAAAVEAVETTPEETASNGLSESEIKADQREALVSAQENIEEEDIDKVLGELEQEIEADVNAE